jgi:hypothetical protein
LRKYSSGPLYVAIHYFVLNMSGDLLKFSILFPVITSTTAPSSPGPRVFPLHEAPEHPYPKSFLHPAMPGGGRLWVDRFYGIRSGWRRVCREFWLRVCGSVGFAGGMWRGFDFVNRG